MTYSLSIAIFIFVCTACIIKADREFNQRGTYLKARGNSGKITIGSKGDPNQITIEFDELKERDSSGNDVGKTGAQKHSFNSFASKAFTFSNIRDITYHNISAQTFSFNAILVENARLTVYIYIFKQNGTIDTAGESQNVVEGTVKFSVKLEAWKFCGTGAGRVTCRKGNTDETGNYIDFTIAIKGKGNPKKRSSNSANRGDTYDLGGNSNLTLSKKVDYDDGTWEDMPSGYPKMVTQGSKTKFIFRFRKFTTSAYYDPTINPDSGVQGMYQSSFIYSIITALAVSLYIFEKPF